MRKVLPIKLWLPLNLQLLVLLWSLAGCQSLSPSLLPKLQTGVNFASCSVTSFAHKANPTPEMLPALEVRIGQMLMVGFRGLEVDEDHFIVRDIKERHLGGVILFDYDAPTKQTGRNIASPTQLRELITSLQKAASYPLLIAVDQEGGRVSRLKERDGFLPTVSHGFLGKLAWEEETFRQASAIAEQLANLGINLNLAPVVDLCLNPDNPIIARLERCFSACPQVVTDQARQFILAHRQQGILTALKHFPGHGSSVTDSHLGLTDITRTWSPEELVAYRNLIDAGLADAIMTAHVFHEELDANWPATLSEKVITGILRNELGFTGLIISDDLQMGAIINHYGLETAIEKAIEAGVDLLIFANNSLYEEDIVRRSVYIIRALVETGRLCESRINESFRRIMRLKNQAAAFRKFGNNKEETNL